MQLRASDPRLGQLLSKRGYARIGVCENKCSTGGIALQQLRQLSQLLPVVVHAPEQAFQMAHRPVHAVCLDMHGPLKHLA